MDQLIAELQPVVITAAGVVISAAILWAAERFRAWTGIQIEAKHREALHTAALSGIKAAVEHGPQAGAEVLTKLALEHVRASVPDALRYFGIDVTSPVLRRIIEAKIPDALGITLSPSVGEARR